MKKLISLLVLLSVLSALAPINILPVIAQNDIYVSRNQATATPGYYCDGVDDQVEISNAIAAAKNSGGRVYLKAGTYIISKPITMLGRSASNPLYLTGEPGAVIKIKDGVIWDSDQALIECSNQTGIVINGITLDGNRDNIKKGNDIYTDPKKPEVIDAYDGKYFYNGIYMVNCNNITIHDMRIEKNRNDGIKAKGCNNINIYNNYIAAYHDGFFGYDSKYVTVNSNTFDVRVNNGVRVDNSNHVLITYNRINGKGGGAGVQVQKMNGNVCDDIIIEYNDIIQTKLSGIWVFGSVDKQGNSYGAAKVIIRNNNIIECGTVSKKPNQGAVGGIVFAGFNGEIYNNKIQDCSGWALGTMDVYNAKDPPMNLTFTLDVHHNNILNVKTHDMVENNTTYPNKAYPIYNKLNKNFTFKIQNNNFPTTLKDTYYQVTPPNPDTNTYK